MKTLKFQSLLLTGAAVGLATVIFSYTHPAEAGDCHALDFTCRDSRIRGVLRENDPSSPAFAENQWGNAGGAGYPAAAQWMRANNGSSQGLDETQKRYLRPHFGNLVDRVAVVYNANLMDEWSALGYRINLGESAAQTYCERIYVDDPYKSGDFSQIELLAHELTHSKQCEQLGGAGKFGYHYFREYKRAGQTYENNRLEREAFDFEKQFAGWLSNQLANNSTPNPPTYAFGYAKNSRLVASGSSPEPMEGHVNWANGQSESTVKNEILSQISQTQLIILQSPSVQSCEAFGYLKNATLTLLRNTTEPHAGHVNWCRDRLNENNWNQVVQAVEQEFINPMRAVLGQ